MSAGETTSQPSNADASSRFGVAMNANGSSRSIAAITPLRAPRPASNTGSTTRFGSAPARALAVTAAAASAEANVPVLTAAGVKSSRTVLSCNDTTVPGTA